MRCGTCKEVFDGNAALVDPAAALLPSAGPVAGPAAPVISTPLSLDIPDNSPPFVSDDEPVYSHDFDTSFDPFGILPDTAQLKGDDLPEEDEPDEGEAIDLDLDIDPSVPGEASNPDQPAADTAPAPLPVPMAPFRRRQSEEAPAFVTYLRDSRREPKLEDEAPAVPVAPAEKVSLAKPHPTPSSDARQEPTLTDHSFDLPAAAPAAEPVEPDDALLPPVAEEPAFVIQGRRREQSGKALRVAMASGAVALLLLLLLQVMTTFRNPLAAQFPQFKPALAALCSVSGCQVDLPAQIEALAIEQGELQTLAPQRFSYVSQLRNLGRSVQAWPSIELILNDDDGKPVLRRVVAPRDYLPAGTDLAKGFAQRSEQNIRLYFSLDQLTASGYHIAIFYP